MIRLERQRSRGGRIGCILGIVALLGTLSYVLLRYAEEWLMLFIGGAFGRIAVLLVLAGVQQTLALAMPETIVEVARP